MPLTAASPVQNRIGEVFVPVSDMDRAIAWYARLFGFDPGMLAATGGICRIPMAGETGLLLDANAPITGHSSQPLCHFLTDDLDAALDHLGALDTPLTGPPQRFDDVAFATFADPDGNPLMICQRR